MNSDEKTKYKGRLLIFYVLLGLMMSVLLSGLGYRQLYESAHFSEQVKVQNHRRVITPAPRGHIFDREGRLLVGNKSKFAAVVFLSDVGVREAFRSEYRALVRDYRERGENYKTGPLQKKARANVIQTYLDDINRMLGRSEKIDPEKVSSHLNYSPLLPFPILDDLTREEFAILLESLPIESPIQIYVNHSRFYPYERTAAHTLGYVTSTYLEPDANLPGDDLTTFAEKGTFGRAGVEKQFDDVLRGKMGSEIWVVDPAGYQVESINRKYPNKGSDVQLALDIDLQTAAEEAFKDKDEDGKPVEFQGALVALDIHTLEVLAMVSKPDYNLNDTSPFISKETFKEINEAGGWQNRAIQGLYPPGSPFKLLTGVAALKAGVITPETTEVCEGAIYLGSARKPCHNPAGHGEVDLQAAIKHSCNVFFYKAGLETTVDGISREAIYLGMDQPTGIDLPNETHRMLVPTREWKKERFKENWYPGDTTNTAIGQGFLRFTPLQMAVMTASIVRNEVVSKPSILKLSPEQIANRPAPKPLGLSQKDHAAVINGMIDAVHDPRGTARWLGIGYAKKHGYTAAGKTGTAEVSIGGGKEINLAWFVCFAPIHDPQIIVATLIEGDSTAFHGGSHAAPTTGGILDRFFEKHPEYKYSPEEISELYARP